MRRQLSLGPCLDTVLLATGSLPSKTSPPQAPTCSWDLQAPTSFEEPYTQVDNGSPSFEPPGTFKHGKKLRNPMFPYPWEDPKSRSTLGFYNLHRRSIRILNSGIYITSYNMWYHNMLYLYGSTILDPPKGSGLSAAFSAIRAARPAARCACVNIAWGSWRGPRRTRLWSTK